MPAWPVRGEMTPRRACSRRTQETECAIVTPIGHDLARSISRDAERTFSRTDSGFARPPRPRTVEHTAWKVCVHGILGFFLITFGRRAGGRRHAAGPLRYDPKDRFMHKIDLTALRPTGARLHNSVTVGPARQPTARAPAPRSCGLVPHGRKSKIATAPPCLTSP